MNGFVTVALNKLFNLAMKPCNCSGHPGFCFFMRSNLVYVKGELHTAKSQVYLFRIVAEDV